MWRRQRSPKSFCQYLRIEKSYSTVHGLSVFSSSLRIDWYTSWHWGQIEVLKCRHFDIEVLKCRHFDFFTSVMSFLTWPKMTFVKNYRARPSVSNLLYHLSLACFVFEISVRGRYPPPVGTIRWPKPPSVRWLTTVLIEHKTEQKHRDLVLVIHAIGFIDKIKRKSLCHSE